MAIAPSPFPSRTQYVLEAIKHEILAGRLQPGRPLVEAELAAQFGVSKTPVREALKTLAGSGLVVMSQYKGATVRAVDAEMAHDVYDVRLLLEPEALRRSIEGKMPITGAEKALARAEHAADEAERSLANRDFHRELYVHCGNPLLISMLDDVREQAALVSTVAWSTNPSWQKEADEHAAILRLVRAGQAGPAVERLREHIASFVHRAFPTEGSPVPPVPVVPADPIPADPMGPMATKVTEADLESLKVMEEMDAGHPDDPGTP
ncbi:DNA-binding GntR family transcriptional regulator [Streptomyces candidus]|uniref:DNA-binding GntR family transcriptional regulator n=1 Tax=Streptomyces candidus TaxID=67283 RepID=A0A7X0LS80_9ACTN|nr:DNA-binding GntR family transcriptional regulator [Streptomyces candidus]GHH44465.1 transcriptional regulator [Streptomyces candidus]